MRISKLRIGEMRILEMRNLETRILLLRILEIKFLKKNILSPVIWPGLSDPFVSQSPKEPFVSHLLKRILICAYNTCQKGQIYSLA